MAQGKKISELTEVSSVTDNDEFLFVDKEGSGSDSGVGGKTAKIKFSNLKASFGDIGKQGDKGEKGQMGPRGIDGTGTQYWSQSPSNTDNIYYDAGNVGISAGLLIGNSVDGNSDISNYLGNSELGIFGNTTEAAKMKLRDYRPFDATLGQGPEIHFQSLDNTGTPRTAALIKSEALDDIKNDLVFGTSDGLGGAKEKMRITSNGSVGIGTNSPIAKLQVETEDDNLYRNGNIMPVIQNVTGCFRNAYSNGIKAGTHTGLQLNVYGNKDSSMDLTDMVNQNVLGYVGIVAEEDNTNKGSLVFHSSPNGTDRLEGMRLTSENNLGIGTTSPVGKLHIESSDNGTDLGPDVILMRESTNPVAGGLLGSLRYQGRTHSENGAIKVEYADIKAEIADPAGGGKLVFRTRQENSGDHHTMVLDNNGNVGIGTESPKAKLDIVVDGNKYSKLTGTFSIDLTTNNGNATIVGVNSLLASEIRPNLEVYAPNNDGVMTFLGQASATDDDLSCFLLMQTDSKQFPAFDNVELYVSDKVVAVTSDSAGFDCFNIRSNKQVEIGGFIESHGLKMTRPGESNLNQSVINNAEYISTISFNGDEIGVRDYVYSQSGQHERTHSDIRGRLSVGTTEKHKSILRVKHHATVLLTNAEIEITKDSNVITAINGTATFLTDFAPGDKFTVGNISASDSGDTWTGIVESVTDDNTLIASTNAPVSITRSGHNQRTRRIYKFSDTYDRSIVRFDKFDNSNAFSVHSDGNVGINTSLPWAPLQIQKSTPEYKHPSNSQISIALEPEIGFGCGIRFHTTGTSSVYAPGTVFDYGDRINHNGDLWEAISSNMKGVEPGTDETKWRLLTEEVAPGLNYYQNVYNGNAIKWNYYDGGGKYNQKMALSNKGGLSVEDGATIRRSFADDPSTATNSAILNVVDTTIADNHKSEFMVLGNGNIHQGGPQHVFNDNGPSTNNTASSVMWSQRLVVPATTTNGTGGYTHYTFNIGNYAYGKFTIMANRTNTNANYVFAEYIVSNNSGTLHSTALNEKLTGGNVEIKITALNNNQTGLSSNQCQFKIAMNQTQSPGSITVFWQGSNSLASTDHDDSHTNW